MADEILVTGQLWSIATTTLRVRLRIQLNSILFAKTLVRKDIASSAATASQEDVKKPATASDTPPTDGVQTEDDNQKTPKTEDEEDFSTKAQIMTLMTTDVDRVSDFAQNLFALVGAIFPRLIW